MKVKMLGLALAFALAGCTTLGLETEEQKVAAACVAASGSIKVLTVAIEEGRLPESRRRMVEMAVAAVVPICTAETPPDLDDVRREAFLGAISALQVAAADAVKEKSP